MTVQKTRAKLVDVARQLFAKKGVEDTTMNDIAVASRKGRRTLYTYFKSKEQIYMAVVESELEMLSDRLKEAAGKTMSPDKKILELIMTHLDTIKMVVYRNGTLRASFFRDIWRVEAVRKHFDQNEIVLFRRILEEGKMQGYFDIDNVDITADILHYCIKGIEVPYIRGQIGEDLDDENRLALCRKDRLWCLGMYEKELVIIIKNKDYGIINRKDSHCTGAARGIGKAIAMKFAAEGANIAFTDLVIDENGQNTEKEIAALGVKVKGYASNAASFEDTAKVVEQIHADFGSVDILVNNAGITKDGLMMRMSEAQWDAVIGVNLKSAFNFIHACTPIMMRQKSGSIINMASVVGVHGNAGQCNYSASKAGMIGLAKSIAQELGSRGIRANAIAPGFIITDMTAKLSDEVKAEWAKKIPLRRGGTPEDVANIALFLASDMSSYVSGQVIQVDGGMNM